MCPVNQPIEHRRSGNSSEEDVYLVLLQQARQRQGHSKVVPQMGQLLLYHSPALA